MVRHLHCNAASAAIDFRVRLFSEFDGFDLGFECCKTKQLCKKTLIWSLSNKTCAFDSSRLICSICQQQTDLLNIHLCVKVKQILVLTAVQMIKEFLRLQLCLSYS